MNEPLTTPFPLLESDLIKTFVAISETGNFSRAAKRVYRTPSAVSMQVKKLEETLGRPLFLREGRQVTLTPDGETLLSYGRRLLKINEEAVSRFLAPAVEGAVSLGAPDDFGTRFLPNILCRFACSHPLVEVNVVVGSSLDLLEQLDDGALDLTLVTSGNAKTPRSDGELVFSEPLVWVGLKGGMAQECDPLPLALSNRGCAWRGAALGALDKVQRRYRVAYTSEHCIGQKAAVVADLAIAPWPASLVEPPLRRLGSSEALPPLGNYHILLHRGHSDGAAVDALAGHVVESFVDFSGY